MMGGKLSEQEYDELLEMISEYGRLRNGPGWKEADHQFGRIVRWVASRTDFGFSRETAKGSLDTR